MTWWNQLDQLLQQRAPSANVIKDAVMSQYTSFRIGGAAKRMLFPRDEAEAVLLLELCRECNAPFLVMGKGTNLLVSDAGLDRAVLNMLKMDTICVQPEYTMCVQSGALLSKIAVQAQQAGYAGLEFAHGIPGSLGGAIAMNAGAYGGEMQQVVQSVTALFPDGVRTLDKNALHFGYRHSIFSEEEGVVLSAVLKLQPGDPKEIRAQMDDLMARRKASQPLEYPSAGSTFKRPEGHFAGTMIDQCGLKGTAVGGAEVSEKHAGFIINKDHATFDNVVTLISIVQDTVYREFGVELEPEVKIIQ